MSSKPTIAIVGGTGDLGSELAKMSIAAECDVIIGSRSLEKAKECLETLGDRAHGATILDAAHAPDIVVLAVPFSSHEETLRAIRAGVSGKIVIDAVVPLVPPKVSVVQLPAAGSAARIAQGILGKDVRVAAAFHNIGATKLHQKRKADCDVLIFADDLATRQTVIELASHVAERSLDAGVLANSAATEALTSVLIGINRKYKVSGAGIGITGLEEISA